MSKALKAVVGLGFTGAAGTAGVTSYIYMTSGETIRDKFSVALIKMDTSENSIWDEKWKKLKVESAKVLSGNEKLKKAKDKSATENADETIRNLMKEGCKEIYDSKFTSEKDNNFQDFKAYCSLWFGDKLKTFIADDTTTAGDNNKWKVKLDSLNSYTKGLVSDLKNIRTGTGDVSAKKKLIKDWCDNQKEAILEATNSDRYVNISDICLGS
ncbi:hypothetical protein A6V39_00575 [Candidatus Mycoplasma haematobovis]|uniref:Uncharacterized protein n=1 Tax=Candidatus Mycoplasma haematobovis TaxID=432608 RepID=A0A1A9QF06_9MOLU|nr:hypothetical protein [Candidatus Mycoplasma haematobovis]OAL10545.1 hypothetical protein A6V39_00575 [Candidatus Mycoplasma haematobovis]